MENRITSGTSNKVLTIPNLLSFYRLLILIPIAILFPADTEKSNLIIELIFISAIISDVSDGIIARKFNQITELGKILDPLIDKISMLVIGTLLVFYRELPLWFMVFLVTKDIFLLIGALFVKRKYDIIMTSVFFGKITALATALTGISYFLRFKYSMVFLWITVVLIVISLGLYLRNFIKICRQSCSDQTKEN